MRCSSVNVALEQNMKSTVPERINKHQINRFASCKTSAKPGPPALNRPQTKGQRFGKCPEQVSQKWIICIICCTAPKRPKKSYLSTSIDILPLLPELLLHFWMKICNSNIWKQISFESFKLNSNYNFRKKRWKNTPYCGQNCGTYHAVQVFPRCEGIRSAGNLNLKLFFEIAALSLRKKFS